LLIWHAGAAFALTGVTIGAVYLALAVHRDNELDGWLHDYAQYLNSHREETLAYPEAWIFLPTRLIDESDKVRFESPRLAMPFPVKTFRELEKGAGDRTAPDGRLYRLVAVQFDGWTYHFAQDRTPESELMRQFRRNVALAALPVFVLSLVVGFALSRKSIRPLKDITSAARGITPAHLDGRVPTVDLPAELRELAETLNVALARMHDAFSRLDQFAADVAHELRTPVHNLRGGIEVAMGQDRTPDEYRQVLTGALTEADRLGRLVDRLLFLAQAEDPRREVRREPVDVAEELCDVREFFEPAASEAGVDIEVTAAAGTTFPLDRALFQRALSNLVGNALAHTPSGGLVCLAAENGHIGLRVTVTDTGSGIPPEDLPHLFDRFYRSRSARASGRGVGLGLAIVRMVVQLHGGNVTVESTIGGGTTVRMTFPLPHAR
jgi:two-component system heavy metal sensor histidine kinase CusS